MLKILILIYIIFEVLFSSIAIFNTKLRVLVSKTMTNMYNRKLSSIKDFSNGHNLPMTISIVIYVIFGIFILIFC